MSGDSILPYLWMLGGAVAFATMGALAHALGVTCDWQIVAVARTALALVFAVVLTLAAGSRLVLWHPRTLWLRSIAGSISLVCTFYALPRMPVAEVLTVTNVFPVWVALLSWPVLGEVPTRETWVAIALGLSGVVLVVSQQPDVPSAQLGAAVLPASYVGLPAAAALLASFTTAIAMLGLHRLQAIDPRAIVAHFSGVALTVCLLALVLVPNHAVEHSHFDSRTLWMLLAVGVCATIGQLFLTKAFAAGPPAKVSVVALTQIVFAVLFDALVWGRSFQALTVVGMLLVMAPTAWLLLRQEQPEASDL
ncbi:MAG: DMT family transporter [Pirellulales bacterium]